MWWDFQSISFGESDDLAPLLRRTCSLCSQAAIHLYHFYDPTVGGILQTVNPPSMFSHVIIKTCLVAIWFPCLSASKQLWFAIKPSFIIVIIFFRKLLAYKSCSIHFMIPVQFCRSQELWTRFSNNASFFPRCIWLPGFALLCPPPPAAVSSFR